MKGRKKKRQRKNQNVREIKLQYLRRELEYQKRTVEHIDKDWKKLCVTVTVPSFRDALRRYWNSFEKVVDLKDYIISQHMKELRAAEDSYLSLFQSHQLHMSQNMERMKEALYSIHENHDRQLKELVQICLDSFVKINNRSAQKEEDFKMMLYRIDTEEKGSAKRWKCEIFAAIDEVIKKGTFVIQNQASILELRFRDIWIHVKKILDDYSVRSDQINRKRNAMTAMDTDTLQDIKKDLQKIKNLEELMKRLKSKNNHLIATNGDHVRHLNTEKSSLSEMRFACMNKLQMDNDIDSIKRTCMAVEFHKCFEDLKEKLKHGESLLKIVSSLHIYETMEEKILPFPCQEKEKVMVEGVQPPEMWLFWQKIGGVEASRYALNEEYLFLKKENHRLKQALHKYCQCAECPSLPTVKERTGKIPYTEGREAVRKAMMHNESSKFSRETSENVSINTNTSGNI